MRSVKSPGHSLSHLLEILLGTQLDFTRLAVKSIIPTMYAERLNLVRTPNSS